MALPLAIPLAISAGTSLFGALQGGKQKRAGEDALSQLRRPSYQIPQELYDNLSDAEKMEVEGLPAEQKKQFVQNIEKAQTSALKAQADRKGGLMGLQSTMQTETDAYSNLVSMDAAAQKESELRKQEAIQRARGAIAGAKNRRFDVASDQYNQDLTSAQGMIGAGQQNIMQGIQGIGSTAMQFGSMMYNPGGGAGTGGSTANKDGE